MRVTDASHHGHIRGTHATGVRGRPGIFHEDELFFVAYPDYPLRTSLMLPSLSSENTALPPASAFARLQSGHPRSLRLYALAAFPGTPQLSTLAAELIGGDPQRDTRRRWRPLLQRGTVTV